MKLRLLLSIGALALGAVAFQNCSEVQFAGEEAPSSKLGEECRVVAKAEVRVAPDATQIVACERGSGENCAVVCHVPPGNPDARHTILVGLPARNGPHQPGGHGGDYDGPCEDGPSTTPETPEEPEIPETPEEPTFEACRDPLS